MSRAPIRVLLVVCFVATFATRGHAQFLPFSHRQTPEVHIRPVDGVRQHIVADGKLHLRLREFLVLALKNNTEINLARLDVENAADAVIAAKAPFDPGLALGFNTNRSFQPQVGALGGAQTLSNLQQSSFVNYVQTLPSGQNLTVGFTGGRNSTNSVFNFFNPAINTGLNFAVTEPLLRNRGNLQFRAPLQIARTELLVTSDLTESRIANMIDAAARQYWDAVQARDNIRVQQQALDLAQKSYEHDQRALQLGALSKLDIFQSEAQVARSRVDLVAAQYAYRQQLDGLRRLIGADVDPLTANVDIALDDDPASVPTLSPLPVQQAIEDALRRRPELKAARRQVAADTLRAAVARNSMLPQFDLNGQYGAYGLGGNQIPTVTPLGGTTSFVPGGLGDALHQMFAFSAPYYGFGIQVSLPFRNSSAEANLADALVAQTRDDYTQRQQTQQIILDVKTADNLREMAAAQIDAAKAARDFAAKNVDAERQKYELGSITAFEELQSQVQLSQAETVLLNAYVNYQKAVIGYQHATWTLLDGLGIVITPPRVH